LRPASAICTLLAAGSAVTATIACGRRCGMIDRSKRSEKVHPGPVVYAAIALLVVACLIAVGGMYQGWFRFLFDI
jgi:hypothetical protein